MTSVAQSSFEYLHLSSTCFKMLFHFEMLRLSYLVTTDTGSLKSFGGQLLVFIRHKMDTEGELIYTSLFTAQIENPDLGIGDTTAEPRFWVRLVLTIAIASCGTTTHLVALPSDTRLKNKLKIQCFC